VERNRKAGQNPLRVVAPIEEEEEEDEEKEEIKSGFTVRNLTFFRRIVLLSLLGFNSPLFLN
jgi:hypothetical protein